MTAPQRTGTSRAATWRRLFAGAETAAPRPGPALAPVAVAASATPPLPRKAEIEAVVVARERMTFPCRFESRCVQTGLAHDGAPATWTEILWIGARLSVLRVFAEDPPIDGVRGPHTRQGIEALEAFDGSRQVIATRKLPSGTWHGSVRTSTRSVTPGRALAGFFLFGPARLGDVLGTAATTVLGWTTVGGARAVLVEVVSEAGRHVAYALDPAHGYLPRAVWCLAARAADGASAGAADAAGDPSCDEVRLACTGADGRTSEIVLQSSRTLRAVEVDVLPGCGAPYPSHVRSENDPAGGVHLEATVRARDDGEDEAVVGTEGAGLAALMPEGGTLLDADSRKRIAFGSDRTG